MHTTGCNHDTSISNNAEPELCMNASLSILNGCSALCGLFDFCRLNRPIQDAESICSYFQSVFATVGLTGQTPGVTFVNTLSTTSSATVTSTSSPIVVASSAATSTAETSGLYTAISSTLRQSSAAATTAATGMFLARNNYHFDSFRRPVNFREQLARFLQIRHLQPEFWLDISTRNSLNTQLFLHDENLRFITVGLLPKPSVLRNDWMSHTIGVICMGTTFPLDHYSSLSAPRTTGHVQYESCIALR